MDSQLPDSYNYKSLSENGLQLSESDFNKIMTSVTKGVNFARAYLETENDPSPKFLYSDISGVIGYSYKFDAINIRMDYLNLITHNTMALEYKDQLVCFVPDKFYMILKYLQWLTIFGIEETIHYYQKHGNSKLMVKFPEIFPEMLSPKSLLLSDLEAEARTTVDKILAANNENPIWENVDSYFSKNFPEYYNKPIEHLATLPKPNLAISFEMESLMI